MISQLFWNLFWACFLQKKSGHVWPLFVGIAKSKSEVLDSGFSVMSPLGEGTAAAAADGDDDDYKW